MEKVIEVSSLTKEYKGKKAIDNLTFDVYKGEILGLLGPNGSGKSTTINSILALLKYQKGSIKIFGKEMRPDSYDIKQKIGVIFQEVAVLDELNVYDNINYFCGLYIQDKKTRERYVEEAIELVGLEEFKKYLPKQLSGGLLRRLNIACGIAHKPEIIFLDEPTVGLDPRQIIEIRSLIQSLREKHTVILSSHILSEVSAVCDYVMIISHGHLVASDTPENLAKLMEGENTLELTIKGSRTEVEGMLNAIPEIAEKNFTSNENGLVQVNVKTEGNEDVREKIFYACAENQCPILRMENTHVSLEDIFLELTSQDNATANNTGASSDAEAIQSLMDDDASEEPETQEEDNREGGQE